MSDKAYQKMIEARSDVEEALRKLDEASRICELDFKSELENIVYEIRGNTSGY